MEERIIEINGKRLYCIHGGKGVPVVMFHGIPTNSMLWENMIPLMEQSCSIYAFDLLGFGRSEMLDSSEINIMSQSGFFIDVFHKLGLKNAVIVGHDIGGGIGQIMAVRSRGLIRAMVLVDSVCYDSWPIELLKVERKVEMLFEHLPPDVIRELFIKYISDGMYNKGNPDRWIHKYWEYFEGASGIERFLRAVKSLDNRYTMEIVPFLYKINMPVLILWGKHDPYIRMSYGYRLSEDIKNSTIEIIEDAGHFLPEDQPEKAAASILKFLKSLESG